MALKQTNDYSSEDVEDVVALHKDAGDSHAEGPDGGDQDEKDVGVEDGDCEVRDHDGTGDVTRREGIRVDANRQEHVVSVASRPPSSDSCFSDSYHQTVQYQSCEQEQPY